MSYVVADLIGPNLSIVDVVVFVGEMIIDHVVDFLLYELPNVIENSLLLLTHIFK
jgi:hypothetical protein